MTAASAAMPGRTWVGEGTMVGRAGFLAEVWTVPDLEVGGLACAPGCRTPAETEG